MYGLINMAVEGLVTERFGEDAWHSIKARAGVVEETFVSMESYPDQITYDLVSAASEELNLSSEQVLQAFGEYWVEYTALEGYGELLDSVGQTFPEFLGNLDQMHARVKLAFPNLSPPSFRVTDETDQSLVLHYYSERPGLMPLVVGLVRGVAKKFNVQANIDPEDRDGEAVLHVSWEPVGKE